MGYIYILTNPTFPQYVKIGYADMRKVRNVIVHNSINSREEFNTLVRNALNVASVGLTPTEFFYQRKIRIPRFIDCT